jgi:hypothetical protein
MFLSTFIIIFIRIGKVPILIRFYSKVGSGKKRSEPSTLRENRARGEKIKRETERKKNRDGEHIIKFNTRKYYIKLT